MPRTYQIIVQSRLCNTLAIASSIKLCMQTRIHATTLYIHARLTIDQRLPRTWAWLEVRVCVRACAKILACASA